MPESSIRGSVEHFSAYRQVESYRRVAELCGTTHKTVKRAVGKAEAGGSTPRMRRPRNIDVVTELTAARVEKSGGRISAKRSLPIARQAGYGHSAGAAAGCASSLSSAGRIECCGAAATSVGSTRTSSCSS